MSVIAIKDAVKEYVMGESRVRALDGVDMSIEQGDFIAIIGASGSGKSTLMHALGLMDCLTSGSMYFEGKDITTMRDASRATLRSRKIGFVFQSFNLLPRLNVVDNVLLPAQYARNNHPATHEDALHALERVGMEHRAEHKPSELSGGERQRVSIARALINKPSLILADEPTGNLDSKNVERILNLFKELHSEGQTIALVTHDNHVASVAENFIRMFDGNIIESNHPHARVVQPKDTR